MADIQEYIHQEFPKWIDVDGEAVLVETQEEEDEWKPKPKKK